MRILVVDDEPGLRALVRRLLELDFDLEVLEADDGLSALDRLLTERVDMVLLDLSMRVMSGIETLEAIRRSPSYGHLPVVMMTGRADEERVKRAVELGITGLVVKPFSRDSLRERVSQIFERRKTQGASSKDTRAPIEIHPSHAVLVVDQNAEFRGLAVSQFGRLCAVEVAENEFAALSRCLAARFTVIVVGAISEFSSPESVAAKIRALPSQRDVQLIAAVPPGSFDATIASGVFNAVILRSFVRATFAESMMRTLGPTSRARLLLHPTSSYMPELMTRLRLDLGGALGSPVSAHDEPPASVLQSRWVFSDIEIQVAQVAWELRLRVPLIVALRLESTRSGIEIDRISENEMTHATAIVATTLAEGVTASLASHDVPTSIVEPRTVLTAPLALFPGLTDASGTRAWFLTAEGEAINVELVPLSPH